MAANDFFAVIFFNVSVGAAEGRFAQRFGLSSHLLKSDAIIQAMFKDGEILGNQS